MNLIREKMSIGTTHECTIHFGSFVTNLRSRITVYHFIRRNEEKKEKNCGKENWGNQYIYFDESLLLSLPSNLKFGITIPKVRNDDQTYITILDTIAPHYRNHRKNKTLRQKLNKFPPHSTNNSFSQRKRVGSIM